MRGRGEGLAPLAGRSVRCAFDCDGGNSEGKGKGVSRGGAAPTHRRTTPLLASHHTTTTNERQRRGKVFLEPGVYKCEPLLSHRRLHRPRAAHHPLAQRSLRVETLTSTRRAWFRAPRRALSAEIPAQPYFGDAPLQIMLVLCPRHPLNKHPARMCVCVCRRTCHSHGRLPSTGDPESA